ncbi:gag polyprotein-related, partial [Trifolium medium]|nr:gag polyprotein-related [Trifolium medium]
TVSEYAAKFEDLCRFVPHYNTMEAEEDKCVKFEHGLRPDIKRQVRKEEEMWDEENHMEKEVGDLMKEVVVVEEEEV